MITRVLSVKEKKQYNKVARHPVQTWEWGDFQTNRGHQIFRLGVFDKNKMVSAYSVSFHHLPKTSYTVGTLLRGPRIDANMLSVVKKLAHQQKAIFVKFEPDVIHKEFSSSGQVSIVNSLPHFKDLRPSPKVAFYPHSYIIDLTKSEDELLAAMRPKTRYNTRIANRHGVKVSQKNTSVAFQKYLNLIFATTVRQGFYLHNRQYHIDQWRLLRKTNLSRLMLASYQKQTLSAFMLFICGDRAFYPYGGSSPVNRQVMAPTLLMWESIKFAKSIGCQTFDMWGSLGPDARPKDPAFGFHRFKLGFGGQMVRFVGTYDLILNPNLYRLYNLVDKCRWCLLRLKTKLPLPR